MNPPTVLENVVKGISNPDVPFLIHEGKIIFADWQTGLHIVSLDTGSPVYSFTTHEDTVSALIIHNRNLLVSGDGFGVIKIHDLNNYECLYSQRVSQDYVSRLSNHNDLIIGGSGDGNLIIIDVKRDFETSVYQRHTKSITSIAFLDGYLITTSPYDESLRVSPLSNPAETLVVLSTKCETALVNEDKIYYLAEKSIEVATIRNGEWNNISSIEVAGSYQALIHHGLLITSAGNDVVVIDLQTEEIAYLQGHTNTVTAIFAHGDILVSGSFDVKLKVWSLHDFLETKNYLGHSYLINQIEAFGDNILSLEKNGQLFFWRYSQPKAGEDEIDLLYYAEGYSHQNNRLVYARKDRVMFLDLDTLRRDVFVAESFWTSFEIDDEYLFITDGDGYLTKIDIASQQVLWRKLFGDNVIIGSVGNRLITKGSSQPDSLMFWDKDSCETVTTINSKIQPEIFVNLPNNMLLLAQPYANEIEIQNIESREEIAKLPISDSYLRGIAVHDENILAILDTGVLSYDLHTFQETQVETLSWEKGSIGKFNIEEKYLALGFKDGSIGLFDKYAAFARVQTFSGHTSGIEAIKILKNTVISADYNRQVHVWRIADGQIVCSLTFDEIINHLDFNEKHKVVILYGYSGRLYLMRPTGFEP